MLSYKVQSSKYWETVKTVKISISNNQLILNRVMYTTYVSAIIDFIYLARLNLLQSIFLWALFHFRVSQEHEKLRINRLLTNDGVKLKCNRNWIVICTIILNKKLLKIIQIDLIVHAYSSIFKNNLYRRDSQTCVL
jgi:hypothetical protein